MFIALVVLACLFFGLASWCVSRVVRPFSQGYVDAARLQVGRRALPGHLIAVRRMYTRDALVFFGLSCFAAAAACLSR